MSKESNFISDEMLSAFLEGNISAEDTIRILKAAEHDEELQAIIKISGEVDCDMAQRNHVPQPIPMLALAAKKKENYLCDIECEEFVLHQFGIEATHKSLLDEAYRNCWLKEKGMPLYNIGRLLEKNNLSLSRRYNCSTEDVKRLLATGNQLIAVVDCSILEANTDTDNMENADQEPNHAVAISSINIEHNEITIYNPSTEEELTIYNLDCFCKAWKESNNYLVVVNTTDKFVYEPYPINLEDVTLSDELTELQEAIAENAHEIWARKRGDEGWSYGPKRNDILKETPDMVPYCNLPESEKLYDREMAMQTLKLVRKLGFEIRKNSNSR